MPLNITYVDNNDKVIGSGPIARAYKEGIIVRIARVFLTNKEGKLLIQKRSDNHPSLPDKWDQTAAGHVDENETYIEAAHRELKEEMGITDVELIKVTKYYKEEDDEAQFIKRRFNSIYSGNYDGEVIIDNNEVSDYKWIDIQELQDWIKRSPKEFTGGFIEALHRFINT